MSYKAVIVDGPDPMQIWMWGIISHYVFIVRVGGRMVTLNIHFQKLTPVPNSEFQIISFKGYDQTTGHRVSCSVYHATARNKNFGKIFISETKARPTELAKKYGPNGWKYRKKPLLISDTINELLAI